MQEAPNFRQPDLAKLAALLRQAGYDPRRLSDHERARADAIAQACRVYILRPDPSA